MISLGGGAWTIPANRALVESENCLTIWLNAPFEICWKRICSGDSLRPLAPDRKAAQQLFESRMDSYALAATHVEIAEGANVEAIAEKIALSVLVQRRVI